MTARMAAPVLLLAALFGACKSGDSALENSPETTVDDRKACLDRPGELPRPPAGHLPCELIPPALSL